MRYSVRTAVPVDITVELVDDTPRVLSVVVIDEELDLRTCEVTADEEPVGVTEARRVVDLIEGNEGDGCDWPRWQFGY